MRQRTARCAIARFRGALAGAGCRRGGENGTRSSEVLNGEAARAQAEKIIANKAALHLIASPMRAAPGELH
eukprot:7835167-Pyramimonas_sp.AAC.1